MNPSERLGVMAHYLLMHKVFVHHLIFTRVLITQVFVQSLRGEQILWKWLSRVHIHLLRSLQETR